jgi:ribose-phosphate pyrophosphokinase
MVIVLISIENQALDNAQFPNGESIVNGKQILEIIEKAKNSKGFSKPTITFRFEDDLDLMRLMFVKRFLDSHNIASKLFITYMPYSRMDRIEGDSVFTLKYAAQFINDLNFEQVTVAEPHSDVTMALLDRAKAIFPSIAMIPKVMELVGFNLETDYLFFPDAGAQKRYGKVKGTKQIFGHKVRDFNSGELTSFQLIGNIDAPGFKAIIVDDLCSRGGTFMGSAEVLKKAGASEIYLIVAHCEKTIYQGMIPDSNLVNRVFTTNSILDNNVVDKITVFDIDLFNT